jgi:hypothetical protein
MRSLSHRDLRQWRGHAALQLSRDLDCQHKTAFVMAHKIREAMASETNGATVSGTVARILAATFARPTTRLIAAIAGLPKIRPASAAWLSSCASPASGRCP